jgi:hypothetical protein
MRPEPLQSVGMMLRRPLTTGPNGSWIESPLPYVDRLPREQRRHWVARDRWFNSSLRDQIVFSFWGFRNPCNHPNLLFFDFGQSKKFDCSTAPPGSELKQITHDQFIGLLPVCP